jgi:hypothetical protein
MRKKDMSLIIAVCILVALVIPAVSAAEPCSFCEFINVSNITRGVTDHSFLTNLSADDHPQYVLTAGTRAFTGMQSMGGFNLTDLLNPVAPQDAATKNYVDVANASMQAYVDAHPAITDHGLLSNLSGDGHPQYILTAGTRAFTGMQSMGGFNLTDLLDPVAPQDAATKSYVDAIPIYNASYITSTYNATYDGNPTQTTRVFSEFYDPSTNAIPGFLGAAISSGTVGAVATTANHPGVIYMRDSTTAAGGYRYGCTGTQLIGGGETFEVVFQPVGVRTTQGAKIGWADTTAANTLPVDGIWFNISGTGAAITLRGATSSNSVRSYTGTSYTPTTATWYRGTIIVNTAGTLVTYTIYDGAGTSQWTDTVATNIPTGAGRDTSPCIIVAESTTDAAANILVMDYVNWGSTRTLVR